jgi:hypothetical protein
MDDWACVEKIEKNKQVSYWLYNKKPFVVTVTLEVDTSNLKTPNPDLRQHLVSQILQGHQRVKVLEISGMTNLSIGRLAICWLYIKRILYINTHMPKVITSR